MSTNYYMCNTLCLDGTINHEFTVEEKNPGLFVGQYTQIRYSFRDRYYNYDHPISFKGRSREDLFVQVLNYTRFKLLPQLTDEEFESYVSDILEKHRKDPANRMVLRLKK